MTKTPKDMKTGTIHMVNAGELEVIGYKNYQSVLVRFIETGYETEARTGDIRRGEVKDRLRPTVYGVGFLGDGSYAENAKLHKDCYQCWANMLCRCYSDAFHKKNKTYLSCEVCEEWQSFQKFAEWYYENIPSDGVTYDLDKDISVDGNKLYSPNTCKFVTRTENVQKAHSGTYSLISPSGERISVTNMRLFCRENNLKHFRMLKLTNGTSFSEYGYKLG